MLHRLSDQIKCGYNNDLSVSDLPKADQRQKDDVARTTRSDRLPRRNDDHREEQRYDKCDHLMTTGRKARGQGNFVTADQTF